MAMMGKDYWGLPICTQWEIHLAIWVGITSIGIVAQGWFILAHSGIFWPRAIVSPMGLITLSSHWRPDWSNQLQRKSLYLMNKVGIQIWFSFCGEGASFNLPPLRWRGGIRACQFSSSGWYSRSRSIWFLWMDGKGENGINSMLILPGASWVLWVRSLARICTNDLWEV